MNLESLPKFYSPKSPKLNDETPATNTDALSITDVMAAQGMVQSKAPLGFSLFLAKVGISDPQTAIDGLMRHAQSLRNPVLMKLSDKARTEILAVLVQFAYTDYSRSAASKSICPHCDGKGILRSEMDVVKHPGVKGVEPKIKNEQVEDICKPCDGKGVISTACRGCKGKGTVIDEKRTKLIGVPVMKVCGRCNGNRFSRVPSTLARVIVEKIVPDLTQYQWYSGYAEVIDKLVTKCWQEEAYAEAQLRKVTR
ncbi:antitermination protein [Citrobacter sp. MNAZ 1397]|uniref:antitermination protein n=1 Tax=Citrobacter sp. MNAZ 1397 TaxID=2911205 RepID=UPI00202611B5|nr:antitermination protein [Citrobacter sp. MNAZ 1397]MCL9671529.1 antitermination protein [Citrobacter sp. MNAZ 1397]